MKTHQEKRAARVLPEDAIVDILTSGESNRRLAAKNNRTSH